VEGAREKHEEKNHWLGSMRFALWFPVQAQQPSRIPRIGFSDCGFGIEDLKE
jgi:hypothetical protein